MLRAQSAMIDRVIARYCSTLSSRIRHLGTLVAHHHAEVQLQLAGPERAELELAGLERAGSAEGARLELAGPGRAGLGQAGLAHTQAGLERPEPSPLAAFAAFELHSPRKVLRANRL